MHQIVFRNDKIFFENEKKIVLVVDKIPDDFYDGDNFGFNKVIKSGVYDVPYSGLPAAIGVKFAALNKTICMVAGTLEFQATMLPTYFQCFNGVANLHFLKYVYLFLNSQRSC